MNKTNHNLKWFHFLVSWILCIASGIVLQVLFSAAFMGGILESLGFSVLTALIALGISSPFIILFCIVAHYAILNKPRTSMEVHLRVLLWHIAGSLLVFVGLVVFFNHEMQSGAGYVILIMLGYFTVDSIYFHSFIHRKMKAKDMRFSENSDILDN